MTTLGVTGGIGSGKSAFVDRLATHAGVRAVRADDVAKRLMADDPAVRAALVARFGADMFAPDGTLDRARLAARVFADPAELAALNAIVHPAVRQALHDALAQARADGVRLFVYEAALLFEVGADRLLDAVVLVDAPLDVRVARVQARDGASREAVEARMHSQIDPAVARARTLAVGGTVVENSGTRADLDALADAQAAVWTAGAGGAA